MATPTIPEGKGYTGGPLDKESSYNWEATDLDDKHPDFTENFEQPAQDLKNTERDMKNSRPDIQIQSNGGTEGQSTGGVSGQDLIPLDKATQYWVGGIGLLGMILWRT